MEEVKDVKDLSNTVEALKIVLQHGLPRNYFDNSTIFTLRRVSHSFLRTVNTRSLFFRKEVFEKVLRKNITSGFPTLGTISELPSFEKALLMAVTQNDKSLLNDYLKEFFSLMVFHVRNNPPAVCCLVEFSTQMGLVAQDFKSLGNEVVQLFTFLTQPITNPSEDNEALLLSYISNLSLCHYYVRDELRENLWTSIRATFAILRGERDYNQLHTRIYKNLSGANFEGVDFAGANLDGSNLQGAKLLRAKLCGTRLASANLEGADLRGADLSWARCFRINLRNADLRDANLTSAECYKINLRNADLRGTIFIGANANFQDSDLNGAVFFDEASIKEFKAQVFQAVSSYPREVFRILFALPWEKLSEADAAQLRQLNGYMRSVINCAQSVQDLSELFSNIKAADHIFGNIYSDLLDQIAKAYTKLVNQSDYKSQEKDEEFKEKLMAEIRKASLSPADFMNNDNNLRRG